jgi:hypothetical protein
VEIYGAIAEVVGARKGADQEVFLRMRVSFVSPFSLVLANLGMIGVLRLNT